MKEFTRVEKFIQDIANNRFCGVLECGLRPPKPYVEEGRVKFLDTEIKHNGAFMDFCENTASLVDDVLYSELTLEESAFVGKQIPAKQCMGQSFHWTPKSSVHEVAETIGIHFEIKSGSDLTRLERQIEKSCEDARSYFNLLKADEFISWGGMSGSVIRQLSIMPAEEARKAEAYHATSLSRTIGTLYLLERGEDYPVDEPFYLIFSPVPDSSTYFVYFYNPYKDDYKFHVAGLYTYTPILIRRVKKHATDVVENWKTKINTLIKIFTL